MIRKGYNPPPKGEKPPPPPKKETINIELKTRIVMDNLKFGWACPLCGTIYSPFVCKCPNEGCKVTGREVKSNGTMQKWEVVDKEWVKEK
jgi:hypothetical protein